MHALFEKIADAHHIAVIAHVHPDADSLGSASAMYTHLVRLEKKVSFFCASTEIEASLACLPWFDKMRSTFPEHADLAIAFDCGSRSRLGVETLPFLVNIDHHTSNEGYGDMNLVDTAAISTTQLLYGLFREADIKINAKMATALYAGLLDDARAFLSPRTDAASFEMAAELLRCGAEAAKCAEALFRRNPLASLRLKGALLQAFELHCGGEIVSLEVGRELMEATGARPEACEAALEEALTLPTARFAVLLFHKRSGGFKVSLRGKGGADLSALAAAYGGGGHRDSAGFETEAPDGATLLASVVEQIGKEIS